MVNRIYEIYALLFAKPIFTKWNRFLLHLALRGLGVLNFRTERLRGENKWLKTYLSQINAPFVIDVGANVGDYTNCVLNINHNSKIISIEPHPVTICALRKNINSNNVVIHNCAVGSKDAILELFDYKNNDGSSHASLYKDVIKDLHKSDAVSHKVSIKTLDGILNQDSQPIDLLKIDTEGSEFNVLDGAKYAIQRTKAIHFEFNEMNIVSKISFKDFWDMLNQDFDFFRILPNGKLLPLLRYSSIECEIYHYQNIVCLRKKI